MVEINRDARQKLRIANQSRAALDAMRKVEDEIIASSKRLADCMRRHDIDGFQVEVSVASSLGVVIAQMHARLREYLRRCAAQVAPEVGAELHRATNVLDQIAAGADVMAATPADFQPFTIERDKPE